MDKAEKKQAYLARAKDAEREAAKAKDLETKDSWLKIAASYRQLAEQS